MTERLLTFTDLDENPLVVRLMPNRIEIAVYDSRPELAAGELRAFVSALFAEYLGPHLVSRLTSARGRLLAARDAAPTTAAPKATAPKATAAAPQATTAALSPLTSALDDALRALDDVVRVMTDAGAIEDPHLPPLPLTRVDPLVYAPLGGPRRTRRARRCEEASTLLAWGWQPSSRAPIA